jgi:hypothetical protein
MSIAQAMREWSSIAIAQLIRGISEAGDPTPSTILRMGPSP